MKVYHFKVSLFDCGMPLSKLHRVLAISEDRTFEELHDLIFKAFDRYDPHLYCFFLTKEDSKNMRTIMDSPNVTNPYSFADGDMFGVKPKNAATMTIKQANLNTKEVIHYWFDFGDDWWHRLRLERITETDDGKPVLEIEKKVGESPAQYPDYEDEDDWDE